MAIAKGKETLLIITFAPKISEFVLKTTQS